VLLPDLGDPEKIAARTSEYEERFMSPFVAAERGYIDEVVYWSRTRRRERISPFPSRPSQRDVVVLLPGLLALPGAGPVYPRREPS
jgi:hypothetical protein